MSRRFHRLYWSAPALWRELTISASAAHAQLSMPELSDWTAAQHRRLQRIAPMLRKVSLLSDGPPPDTSNADGWSLIGHHMGALPSSLISPALESLSIGVYALKLTLPAAVALASMPALKHLEVGSPYEGALTGSLPSLSLLSPPLRALTGLESLKLGGKRLPAGAAASLGSMAHLTRLVLIATEPLPPAVAAVVSTLPALKLLSLHELDSREGEGADLPDPFWMEGLNWAYRSGRSIQVCLPARHLSALLSPAPACACIYARPAPDPPLHKQVPSFPGCETVVRSCRQWPEPPSPCALEMTKARGGRYGSLAFLSLACVALASAWLPVLHCPLMMASPAGCLPALMPPSCPGCPGLQCGCCNSRSLEANRVCMRYSAPLLGMLRGCGVGGGHLETLVLTDCHLWPVAVLPPPGRAAEAQFSALAALVSLHLNDCDMEQARAQQAQSSAAGVARAAHTGSCPSTTLPHPTPAFQGKTFSEFLAALLPQLPALNSLQLTQCNIAAEVGLGDVLSLAGHLTWLALNRCNLGGLPGGDLGYLAGRRGACWLHACP